MWYACAYFLENQIVQIRILLQFDNNGGGSGQ